MLEDSKNEIQNRLDTGNENLWNIEQIIRYIQKYDEINPFVFNNIDQYNKEINLNDILDISENIKTNYERRPVADVLLDSQRDNYPFTLNGENILNDVERFQVNKFYKKHYSFN